MSRTDPKATRGAIRAARGLFVGLLTVTLGSVAHVLGGGMALPVQAVLVMSAVAAALCWRLSTRRWNLRTLIATFMLAQLAIHWIAMVQHPSMTMSSGAMIWSHVGAAALLVILVRHGERAVWRLVEHFALRAVALRRQPSPFPNFSLPDVVTARIPQSLRVHRPTGRAPPFAIVANS